MALNIPCPNRPGCTETLLTNQSSERNDAEVFVGVYFPPVNPPLNRSWIGEACGATCISFVSQEDANLCAAARAANCDPVLPPPPDPPPPVCVIDCSLNPPPVTPPPVVPPVNPPVADPCNDPQTACVQCPDGTEFCYTVPRCTFFAATKPEADAIALSYAQKQATLRAMCVSGQLENACIGVPYSSSFDVSGGEGPFAWTVVSGTVPLGLAVTVTNATRRFTISGTPSGKGFFPLVIRVEDPLGNFVQREGTIAVIALGVDSPPNSEIGQAYSFQFTASGGTPPFTFAVTSGALPPGLTLSAAGLLSGTPTTNGQYDFVVTATDTNNASCTKDCTIVIGGDCEITTDFVLPFGQVQAPYNAVLDSTLGVGNGQCHWTIDGGSLPPGLTLLLLGQGPTCSGIITGTPPTEAVGGGDNPTHTDYTFTARVTSVANPTITCAKEFILRVTNPCGTIAIDPEDIQWAVGAVATTGNISVVTFTDGAHATFTINSDAAGGNPNRCSGQAFAEGPGGLCNPRGPWTLHARFTVSGSIAASVGCSDGAPDSFSRVQVALTNVGGTINWLLRTWQNKDTGDPSATVMVGPFSETIEADIPVPNGPAVLSLFFRIDTQGGGIVTGDFELTPHGRPPTIP